MATGNCSFNFFYRFWSVIIYFTYILFSTYFFLCYLFVCYQNFFHLIFVKRFKPEFFSHHNNKSKFCHWVWFRTYYCYFAFLDLTYFCLTKSCVTIFQPEIFFASVLHLLISNIFIIFLLWKKQVCMASYCIVSLFYLEFWICFYSTKNWSNHHFWDFSFINLILR